MNLAGQVGIRTARPTHRGHADSFEPEALALSGLTGRLRLDYVHRVTTPIALQHLTDVASRLEHKGRAAAVKLLIHLEEGQRLAASGIESLELGGEPIWRSSYATAERDSVQETLA